MTGLPISGRADDDEFPSSQQHWSRDEWFYMWTQGLDPRRIAKTCRVPYRKVYDHIRVKLIYNPSLFGQRLMLHDQPALLPKGMEKRKIPWEVRSAELASFWRVKGKFPRGYVEAEGALYSFLQYQRRSYRAGLLADSKKAYLDEHVQGWLTPPKAEREQALWAQRISELESFVSDKKRNPQYKAGGDPLENVLGVWLIRQRDCLRTGKLGNHREQQLNRRIPGWQGGQTVRAAVDFRSTRA